jgi:hypothetical protein
LQRKCAIIWLKNMERKRFDGNYCKYFADLEADPYAIPPQMTVREFLGAKEHVKVCDVCSNRVDRVLATAPQEEFGSDASLN